MRAIIKKSIDQYYWDSCLWIELISGRQSESFDRCRYVLDLVKLNEAHLYTSAFTLAEVWKVQCSNEWKTLIPDMDQDFIEFRDNYATIFQVDYSVGNTARKLLREYVNLKKPSDAIHLASCINHSINEFHTFDKRDFLNKFKSQLYCHNEKPLTIASLQSALKMVRYST